MTITIFAKKRTTHEGKTFYSYLSTLKKNDGSEQTVSVKFREECGTPEPKTCPCNIIVEKSDCNLSKREFVNEKTGEMAQSFTLWVSSWKPGAVYVDHSLDDYDI